ncbi:uncharacterized protein LOC122320303 [Drosophila ficusphila]|uniref:uncharacterized protein LOC122320303 n=1 Tax=Drosophila ficusphila TaxID=30025 RepID=UPI001C89BE25|nr:uncharacterized protein LOC122320303 [Drosophila ficusphila]
MLPQYNSIFTAEAFAILQACLFAKKHFGQFVICTDSLSTLSSLRNWGHTDPTIEEIRKLSTTNKITLLWTPSHQGIVGNELADQAAQDMRLKPSPLFSPFNSKDISNLIRHHLKDKQIGEWELYNHRYFSINNTFTKISLPAYLGKRVCSTFIRLRIGHTRTTHEHILTGTPRPSCLCGKRLEIDHLLNSCRLLESTRAHVFKQHKPSDSLNVVSQENITNLYTFVIKSNLNI